MIKVTEIFQSEIIISEISNLLRKDRHVAIGAASPILIFVPDAPVAPVAPVLPTTSTH
mgnify:CR=1 FL=1